MLRNKGRVEIVSSVRKMLVTFIAILVTCSYFFGCKKEKKDALDSDVIMMMGDSILRKSEVVRRIPVGIDSADSAALFRTMVDNWVKRMVLADIAREKLSDYEEIERQVEDYRNRLIVEQYLQRVMAGKSFHVSKDSIESFYSSHKGEMNTENPLVKGVFVRMPENSFAVSDVKRCIFAGTESAIDEFEKKWMGETSQYDYFVGDWTDWETIAEQIPYRFEAPDSYLSSNHNFETTYKGSVYLLHIDSYLPSGSQIPFEFASPRISAILEQAKMTRFEEDLVANLVKKAISDERLVVIGYDPLLGEGVSTDINKEKTNLK